MLLLLLGVAGESGRWRQFWIGRPCVDWCVVAAALAIIPGMVIVALNARRPALVHLIPVIAVLAPLGARTWKAAFYLRLLSVVLLGAFVVLGALSIGYLFLPVTAVGLVGALMALYRWVVTQRRETC